MLSFIQSLTLTVLLAFLLRAFVLQPFIVEGESMEPNFHNKEYIIIDKLSYRLREPKRGEVIVLHPPIQESQNYIKRIIGLPGEHIHVDNGVVSINGKNITEPYVDPSENKLDQPGAPTDRTLGKDEYFVMGDNRDHSSDSRDWGVLTKSNIEGRTWLVVLPFNEFQIVKPPTYTTVGLLRILKLTV